MSDKKHQDTNTDTRRLDTQTYCKYTHTGNAHTTQTALYILTTIHTTVIATTTGNDETAYREEMRAL